MTVEAPYSNYNLKSLKLYIAAALIIGTVLAYDGYLSKYEWSKRADFYKEHVTDNGGKPDSTMMFNQYAPPVCLLIALLFTVRFNSVKGRNVIAYDNSLVVCKHKIVYDTIQQIDKTHFDGKGYFVITYKNNQGTESELKLDKRTYDNLDAILELLVSKIS